MAVNLDDFFVTVEVVDRGSNRVLHSQEIPESQVGRFAVTFAHNVSQIGNYQIRIRAKNGDTLNTV